MKFNQKAARYYDKYTAEIKQNLERGTAVWSMCLYPVITSFMNNTKTTNTIRLISIELRDSVLKMYCNWEI